MESKKESDMVQQQRLAYASTKSQIFCWNKIIVLLNRNQFVEAWYSVALRHKMGAKVNKIVSISKISKPNFPTSLVDRNNIIPAFSNPCVSICWPTLVFSADGSESERRRLARLTWQMVLSEVDGSHVP